MADILEIDASLLYPYAEAPVDYDGNTTELAYLRRIDKTVSRMAEDIDLVKTRLADLESRITNLEAAVHKRLDNIGARLHRTDRNDKQ